MLLKFGGQKYYLFLFQTTKSFVYALKITLQLTGQLFYCLVFLTKNSENYD